MQRSPTLSLAHADVEEPRLRACDQRAEWRLLLGLLPWSDKERRSVARMSTARRSLFVQQAAGSACETARELLLCLARLGIALPRDVRTLLFQWLL